MRLERKYGPYETSEPDPKCTVASLVESGLVLHHDGGQSIAST